MTVEEFKRENKCTECKHYLSKVNSNTLAFDNCNFYNKRITDRAPSHMCVDLKMKCKKFESL